MQKSNVILTRIQDHRIFIRGTFCDGKVMAYKQKTEADAVLAERLRMAGLRPTRQRLTIAALLLDGRHRHVSAESLSVEIRSTGAYVSDATIYNTLNQFTDAGLLRRVTVHKDHSVFDTNIDHHHHFYDAKNDQLFDVPSDHVVLAQLPTAPAGHDIASVDVVITLKSHDTE